MSTDAPTTLETLKKLGLDSMEQLKKFAGGSKYRTKKKCLICGGIMLVADGQEAKYHGRRTSPYKGGCRQFRHNKKLSKIKK